MNGKVVVIGANGALGTDLMKVLAAPVAATRADFDIRDRDAARRFLAESGAAAVVNTAAFHDVPLCESEYQRAFEVNVIAVRGLAEICADLGMHFCHISTDYVFDGEAGRPYLETDPPAPLSIYAMTKLAGEYAVRAYGGEDVSIVRSCGLYGEVPTRVKGRNFVTTMVALGRSRDVVTVVDDEIVCPTYTADLAHGIAALLAHGGRGTFHITQAGETSWYEFAKVIFERMRLPAVIEPVPATSFQTVVKRPGYSILDNGKFNALTGAPLPHWRDALLRHLDRYIALNP